MIILTKKIILLFSVFFILACNTGKLINTTTELKKKHDCCKDSLSDQIYEKKIY